MARKKKLSELTARQAHAALRWLHALGEVTAKDIERALSKRAELVAQIRARLEELGGQGARFLTSAAALKKPVHAKRRRATPAARKAWALTGAYAGSVRQLSKANRAKVRAIKEKKGVEAAIAAAKKMKG